MDLAVDDVRWRTKILVEREEIRSQSRMVAYERVGSQIGISGMWVRRFVKGYADTGLNWEIGRSIVALYEKIENDNERIARKIRTVDGCCDDEPETAVEAGACSRSLLPPLDL